MQTYSGKQFWPCDPRPEELDITDIAAALSKQCRYGGHTQRFYSVAEHCVHVASFAPAHLKLTALLHDASEAYLVDMPRPVKASLSQYQALEERLEQVIAKRYGLKWPWDDAVKHLDNRILSDEFAQIMVHTKNSWGLSEEPLGIKLPCWLPGVAERHYIVAFKTYIHGTELDY